jgi:hypothetical protein
VATEDEYGRTPVYAPTTPASPEVRKAMFGPTVKPRPVPTTPAPAFTNDQETA